MSTFTAKYRGACAVCPEPIRPGEEVIRVDGELSHAQCEAVDPIESAKPGETVCQQCFTIHRGECL